MKAFFALALCAALAAGASAQNVIQTAGQSELQRSNATNADQQVDQFVASCLILANQGEVEVAKFGQQNVQDDQVKQFAKKLAEDHQKLVSDLQRFAPQGASLKLSSQGSSWNDANNTNRQPAQARQGLNQQQGLGQQPASQLTASQNSTQQKLIDIKKQATQNCVSMTKQELQEKQGKEMAQAFVGCQIASHMTMLAELKAAENAVSGELRQVISSAKQKVESHLDKAKELMEEQENG